MLTTSSHCTCGSQQPYKSCCQPYHLGKANAPTASALMQSRYVAFVRQDADYLYRTWAKETRPSRSELARFSPITWTGLHIIATQQGSEQDDTGMVTFIAHFIDANGQAGTHHEVSQFVREKGRWLYVSGVVTS